LTNLFWESPVNKSGSYALHRKFVIFWHYGNLCFGESWVLFECCDSEEVAVSTPEIRGAIGLSE